MNLKLLSKIPIPTQARTLVEPSRQGLSTAKKNLGEDFSITLDETEQEILTTPSSPTSSVSSESSSTIPKPLPELGEFLSRRFTMSNKRFNKQEISEEEAYRHIISHSLRQQISQTIGVNFDTLFSENYPSISRQSGLAGFEKAADLALDELVEKRLISVDKKNSIQETAFKLAQFDSDTSQLYDSFAEGSQDSTVAKLSINDALKRISVNLTQNGSDTDKRPNNNNGDDTNNDIDDITEENDNFAVPQTEPRVSSVSVSPKIIPSSILEVEEDDNSTDNPKAPPSAITIVV
jgi:hypothetical protein